MVVGRPREERHSWIHWCWGRREPIRSTRLWRCYTQTYSCWDLYLHSSWNMLFSHTVCWTQSVSAQFVWSCDVQASARHSFYQPLTSRGLPLSHFALPSEANCRHEANEYHRIWSSTVRTELSDGSYFLRRVQHGRCANFQQGLHRTRLWTLYVFQNLWGCMPTVSRRTQRQTGYTWSRHTRIPRGAILSHAGARRYHRLGIESKWRRCSSWKNKSTTISWRIQRVWSQRSNNERHVSWHETCRKRSCRRPSHNWNSRGEQTCKGKSARPESSRTRW